MSATAKEFANDPCSSVKRGEMINQHLTSELSL